MAFDLAAALALKPVSKLDTENEVKMIDLALIDPHPDNFFTVEADITDLAESISLNGLLQPLVVTPAAEGRYRTIAGHRRRKALLKLAESDPTRWKRVPCMVAHPASHELEELALIQTNTEAREIGWSEKNKAATRVEEILVKLQKEQGVQLPGKMRTHVAKIIKTSESQIARAKFIANNLIKPLREHSPISDAAAYKLAHMPEADQDALYRHYMGNLWRLDQRAIAQYEENVKAGRQPFAEPPKEPRSCYVQPKIKGTDEWCKCDHEDVIAKRKQRKDIPAWQKCGWRSCCENCEYRFDCPDACQHCEKEIKKAKNSEAFARNQRLRAAREAAKISVEEAATLLEMSYAQVLLSETTVITDTSTLAKFCTAYHCTPNQILGFEDKTNVQPQGWLRLHMDATPEKGQLCLLLVHDNDNSLSVGGRVVCSVWPARWSNGKFVSARNGKTETKQHLIGWQPMPELPEKYTLSLGKLDGLKEE